MNYYNEFDPKTAAWLRELIKAKLIPAGDVDERSIVEVQSDEIKRYTQVHFFAGIGGWSHALRLAGWPDDKPVWTGSCPCQPFSAAGKNKGKEDERHLWPHMFRLIRECRPSTVFGEQVEGAVRHGWLDGICGDLEAEGYAVGAHVLGAHGVGSPHIRQRLYWVADAPSGRRQHIEAVGRKHEEVDCATKPKSESCGDSIHGGVGDATAQGLPQRTSETLDREEACSEPERSVRVGSPCRDSFDWLPCTDGKARRIESGTFPLAHGVPARVVRLRGYGNAIVPQVAAEFVKAFMK